MSKRYKSAFLAALAIISGASALGILTNVVAPNPIPFIAPPPPTAGKPVDFKTTWDIYDSKKAVFIDARTSDEYRQGHIKGAINVDNMTRDSSLSKLLKEIPPDKLVITYCDGAECEASKHLSGWMLQKGWRNVKYFTDGYPAWQQAGLDVSTGTSP